MSFSLPKVASGNVELALLLSQQENNPKQTRNTARTIVIINDAPPIPTPYFQALSI